MTEPAQPFLSRSWLLATIAIVCANFVLLVPSLLAFQSFMIGDLGWAITVDALWDQGLMPTRDYMYFYGLLTLILDRAIFALLGRGPNAQAVLYFLFNVAITFGYVRFVAAAQLGRIARIFAIVAAPLAVMPVVFPSPTHGLEAALLINALALQARGRYSFALALVTACVFVKPSMALVYGAILTALILFESSRSKWRSFLPAILTALSTAGMLAAVFGTAALVKSLSPADGMKVYADEHYGFFFGVGRGFWLVEPFTLWHYLLTPVGFWLLGTAVLILGGFRTAVVGRGRVATATSTCTILHIVFICFLFGNHLSWIYYSYFLVLGLCGVLNGNGLAPRSAPPNLLSKCSPYALIGLAASAQVATVAFSLLIWTSATRTADTCGLFADQPNANAWAELRDLAQRDRVFLLAPTGAGHILRPEVEGMRSWFLLRAATRPEEINAVRSQIRSANWVIVPRDFANQLDRWPELSDELREGHFQLVKEYPQYLLLRRSPAK